MELSIQIQILKCSLFYQDNLDSIEPMKRRIKMHHMLASNSIPTPALFDDYYVDIIRHNNR